MTRIDGLSTFGAGRTQQGHGASGVDGAASGASGEMQKAGGRQDVATLSLRGRVMADVASAVAGASEVRADRVAALKASIANGTYASDPEAIASRLLASGSFGGD